MDPAHVLGVRRAERWMVLHLPARSAIYRSLMLLAIETSSRVGSVALSDGPAVVGERSFSHGLQNAAKVLPLIDELCREHKVGPGDHPRGLTKPTCRQ